MKLYIGYVSIVTGFLLLVAGAYVAAAPVATPNTLLSMGDSYAMGAPSDGTITNQFGCKRNDVSYNSILASRLNMKALNVSCSGATTTDMINGSSRQASQLDSITSDVKLTTVSAGGNDVQFVQNVIPCVFMADCTDTSSQVVTVRNLIQTKLGPNLESFYGKIKQRTNAPVYAVGYPIFIASSHSLGEPMECNGVSAKERVLFNTVVREMNAKIAQAAQSKGLKYVDPFVTGSPFSAVDSKNQALDMCSNSTEKSVTTRAPIPYHPTLSGVNDFADLIGAAL